MNKNIFNVLLESQFLIPNFDSERLDPVLDISKFSPNEDAPLFNGTMVQSISLKLNNFSIYFENSSVTRKREMFDYSNKLNQNSHFCIYLIENTICNSYLLDFMIISKLHSVEKQTFLIKNFIDNIATQNTNFPKNIINDL